MWTSSFKNFNNDLIIVNYRQNTYLYILSLLFKWIEGNKMIDMKQIKENVSSKLKTSSEPDAVSFPVNDVSVNKQATTGAPMAIGATIHIKGDVTGDEDLIIHGHVEGEINLRDHNVIIGKQGRVKANIHAKQIVVEGELNGDLKGEEKVVIRNSGNVLGNVVSPRVTLEDGAMFKGSIEMEPRQNSRQDQSKHNNNKHEKNTTSQISTTHNTPERNIA